MAPALFPPRRAALVLPLLLATAAGNRNIYGGELQTCSRPGMAMTGFTRDGHCADLGPSDAGSHHICIQMKRDFCTVTGQPNWCTEREMPCMGMPGSCKIGNWCVCQWAFARYLERAGGCDSIVDLVCNATHEAAFRAYARSSRKEHVDALDCIKKRCGIEEEQHTSDTQLLDLANAPRAPRAAEEL